MNSWITNWKKIKIKVKKIFKKQPVGQQETDWKNCPQCKKISYLPDLIANSYICECSFHFDFPAKNRLDSLSKVIPSKIFNWINKKLFGVSLKDNDSGFRVIRREAAKKLDLYGDLYRFIPALLASKGYSVTEVSVNHRPRNSGESKYGYSRFLTGLLDILTMKLILDFTNRPSHLFGYMALGFITVGVFAELIAVFYRVFLGHLFITHMPIMIFGVMTIILGASFFGVGLLGELIVHQKRGENLYELDHKQ